MQFTMHFSQTRFQLPLMLTTIVADFTTESAALMRPVYITAKQATTFRRILPCRNFLCRWEIYPREKTKRISTDAP